MIKKQEKKKKTKTKIKQKQISKKHNSEKLNLCKDQYKKHIQINKTKTKNYVQG